MNGIILSAAIYLSSSAFRIGIDTSPVFLPLKLRQWVCSSEGIHKKNWLCGECRVIELRIFPGKKMEKIIRPFLPNEMKEIER